MYDNLRQWPPKLEFFHRETPAMHLLSLFECGHRGCSSKGNLLCTESSPENLRPSWSPQKQESTSRDLEKRKLIINQINLIKCDYKLCLGDPPECGRDGEVWQNEISLGI